RIVCQLMGSPLALNWSVISIHSLAVYSPRPPLATRQAGRQMKKSVNTPFLPPTDAVGLTKDQLSAVSERPPHEIGSPLTIALALTRKLPSGSLMASTYKFDVAPSGGLIVTSSFGATRISG